VRRCPVIRTLARMFVVAAHPTIRSCERASCSLLRPAMPPSPGCTCCALVLNPVVHVLASVLVSNPFVYAPVSTSLRLSLCSAFESLCAAAPLA
jgi:hypothetical protein